MRSKIYLVCGSLMSHKEARVLRQASSGSHGLLDGLCATLFQRPPISSAVIKTSVFSKKIRSELENESAVT
jgi:hypothetical protein